VISLIGGGIQVPLQINVPNWAFFGRTFQAPCTTVGSFAWHMPTSLDFPRLPLPLTVQLRRPLLGPSSTPQTIEVGHWERVSLAWGHCQLAERVAMCHSHSDSHCLGSHTV